MFLSLTQVNGVWPELEAAAEQVIIGIIPRLLGILQANDRKLKPSLIHGDCWEGRWLKVSCVLMDTDLIFR